jgi:hypothetical protein
LDVSNLKNNARAPHVYGPAYLKRWARFESEKKNNGNDNNEDNNYDENMDIESTTRQTDGQAAPSS